MKNIKLNEECIHCIISKYLKDYPENAAYEKRIEYIQDVLAILAAAKPYESAPELVERVSLVRERVFGAPKDFTAIKKRFNALVMSLEDEIYGEITNSDNIIKTALKYSMIGNYIDFGVVENVDEKRLMEFLDKAPEIEIREDEFTQFETELGNAQSLVFLTDNCGEVVLDKLLIKAICSRFPNLNVEVIVRGLPVLNDATMDDAKQVGLDSMVSVTDNGCGIAGTCLDRISADSREKIDTADVILAKGQGNFETLRFCEKNVYYAFMCKCKMFADKFGVPQYTGMFINDLRI
ncbi:MAG: DUF89 family protein [Ruminococcaceae bacterium]|nr:DUF89 family protein [Oscillospiraceae bacterium]